MSSAAKAPFLVPHCEAPIQIIHADEHLLVVVKPSGLLSVPGRDPRNHDSVINRVLVDYPDARIVHRLDMDTSGLMVLPIGAAAHSSLGRQFQQRLIRKQYDALVIGHPDSDSGVIDQPLITDWPNRPLQKICHETGNPSLTRYQVLARFADHSHLRLFPETGRSHQLRVHCASMGHAILGDVFYAPERAQAIATRLMLHASQLQLQHPITGEPMDFDAPADFPALRL